MYNRRNINNRPVLYPRQVKPARPWRDNVMEFETDTHDHNVAEYHDNFGHTLPKIVMVNQGFCGDIIQDTFDRQQIMRLHTVSKQKRVISRFVVSGQKRLVSIPLSYDVTMCVLDMKGRPGKKQHLQDIVEHNRLPVNVQFPHDHTISVGNQNISTNWIPKMELVQIFDEMYFLSNFIIDGVLVADITPVPLYLGQLRLIEVTGIKGQPREKWTSYCEQLDLACAKLHYDLGFGNSEVAVYDPSKNYTDSTYSYVEPTIYSPMFSFFKKPILSYPSYTISEEPEGAGDTKGDVYDEIRDPRADVRSRVTGNTKLNSELKHLIGGGQPVLQSKGPVAVAPPVVPEVQASTEMESRKPYSRLPPVPSRKPERNLHPTVHSEPSPYTSRSYSNVATKFIPTVQETKIPEQSTAGFLQSLESTEEVAKLSIDELCKYLTVLNLGQYADKFKAELIDGSLLVELDKETLKKEFGLKTVEAIRLEKFAQNGHVPR